MSHFSVLVIGGDVEGKLAPYDEAIQVEPYKDEYGEETTYNPKSKWDWYSVGGRWRGALIPKNGSTGLLGEPGVFNNGPRKPDGVDSLPFGEVDWEATQTLTPKEVQATNDLWDWIEGKITDKKADERRVFTLYKPEYYLKRYGTREGNLKSDARFTTFAVVTEDGEWHETGEMGWFGATSATPEDEAQWAEHYWDRFLKDLQPDTLVTVVDCHI